MNIAAIGKQPMTKEQMEARISLLSEEIDANEAENRIMQEEIDQLYIRIEALNQS